MPVLEVLPLIEDIRISRVKGKTLFEMSAIIHFYAFFEWIYDVDVKTSFSK